MEIKRVYQQGGDKFSHSSNRIIAACMCDAEERQDVEMIDVLGAFIHAKINDIIHVKVTGKMAELLIKIAPAKYGPHVIIKHGKNALYI